MIVEGSWGLSKFFLVMNEPGSNNIVTKKWVKLW